MTLSSRGFWKNFKVNPSENLAASNTCKKESFRGQIVVIFVRFDSEENHNYYLENSSFENFARNREFHNYTIRSVQP